jgi:hypothetical protein
MPEIEEYLKELVSTARTRGLEALLTELHYSIWDKINRGELTADEVKKITQIIEIAETKAREKLKKEIS